MIALVFLGGEGPDKLSSVEVSATDVVVAADSGLDLARRLSIVPHYILGDFDSISSSDLLDAYPGSVVQRYEREKDFTDAELAVKKARELGCEEIVLIGGGGGRVDHLLALLAMFERAHPPTRWLTGSQELRPVSGKFSITGQPGEMVSLFPLGIEICRMRSRGLKWELNGLEWKRGDQGVSNEFLDRCVEIEMIAGRLLMVLPERGS